LRELRKKTNMYVFGGVAAVLGLVVFFEQMRRLLT
jgi:hypothetical protein